MKFAAVFAGALTVVTYILVQSPSIYFLAAFGIVITQIIPSIMGLKKESNNV